MNKVAAFGEVMMRLETPRYLTLQQGNQLQYSFSGSGVNVIAALARFGHNSSLVSALPDNSLGDAAVAFLRKLGIDTHLIQRSGSFIGTYFLEHGFGSRPSKVTYTDRLGSSFNRSMFTDEQLEQAVADIDLIHFCGISLAMNDTVRQTMKRLAREMKDRGKKVAFDCNYRPSLWGPDGYTEARPHYQAMLELADIVMMNERDALHVLGMTTTHTEAHAQLQSLIPRVAQDYHIPVLAGTHRAIGSDNTHTLAGFLFSEENFYFAPKRTFSVYDRIGAGDAYASGIIHGTLRGESPAFTVSFASAAAMLAHTYSGDTPMSTRAEVIHAMTDSVSDVER